VRVSKSSELGGNENGIDSNGKKYRTRRNKARPARMVLFAYFGAAVSRGGLPVMSRE
jgi:hypothetical protein